MASHDRLIALGALVLGAAVSAMLTPLVVAALRRAGHERQNFRGLRPLRALKGFALAAVPLWGWLLLRAPQAAASNGLGALIGAALAYAPSEARQQAMLGDAGANLLGAFLGFAAASTLPWPA